MPSRARQVAGNRQYNNLVAAFRCRGRSSMASNSSATKRARTFSARRPAGRLFYELLQFVGHPGAVNYLGAKRNGFLGERRAKSRDGAPLAHRSRSLSRSSALELGAPGTWRA